MKEYKVRLKYRTPWGVRAENEKEADVQGRIIIADLVMKGIISLDISGPLELYPCDGCDELFTDAELSVQNGRRVCGDCSF